jgi:hypothetical protein
MELCVACSIGHHRHCGMQTWCECKDGRDGDDPDGRETCHACEEAQMPPDDYPDDSCPNCGGTGYSHHDCGEDSCCCLYPDDNVVCDWCQGKG